MVESAEEMEEADRGRLVLNGRGLAVGSWRVEM
jgi:hypothetical protein